MKLFSFLNRTSDASGDCELPDIYPLALTCNVFIKADLKATYRKILTDTLERTHGLNDDQSQLLWDNCVQNESTSGLVTLLVEAMINKADLFLVHNKAVKVLRPATSAEQQQIRADYKQKGDSKIGVFLSFRNYDRTDMLSIYAALEHCILASLHKTVNISKAVQIKMSELRASTSLADSGVATAQAKALAEALKSGKDVFLDADDEITTATPNIAPTEKAITFLDAKRAYYLDLPISYVSGLQTPGIGSTGEADMRAVERGLKQYFFSIIQPTLKAIFDADTEFKSQDFRQITSALEALKTFDLVSDENFSVEAKREILARMFDIDPDAEAKALKREAKERDAETPEVPAEDFTNEKPARTPRFSAR